MKTLSSILLVISAFILDSCTTTKLLTSDVKPSEVVDLQYFEPFSNVSLMYEGNEKILNDSLSNESKQRLYEIVQEFKDKISLTGTITVTSNTIKQRVEKDIENLVIAANDIKNSRISSIRTTPLIDSLLKSNNKRFGLITVDSGYIKTNPLYTKQILASASLNIILEALIFRYPSPTPHPNKAYSALYVIIVDADQGNLAFYRKTVISGSPTDKSVLRDQFTEIFKDYYF